KDSVAVRRGKPADFHGEPDEFLDADQQATLDEFLFHVDGRVGDECLRGLLLAGRCEGISEMGEAVFNLWHECVHGVHSRRRFWPTQRGCKSGGRKDALKEFPLRTYLWDALDESYRHTGN